MDYIYQYCRELLEYVDEAEEIIHAEECEKNSFIAIKDCTCGLERILNNIRTELEVEVR